MSFDLCRSAVRMRSRVSRYAHSLRGVREDLAAIIMYHGVVREPLWVKNWCQLEADLFEQQIKFLVLEYRIFPLREIIERLEKGMSLPPKCVVLTFDDGLRSVCTTAFPILERYQAPFTVFLVTGLMTPNQHPWPDLLFLSLVATKKDSLEFDNTRWPLTTPAHRARAYYALASKLKRLNVDEKENAMGTLLSTLDAEGDADEVFDLMNWEDVRSLSRSSLADFGSHTQTHQILSRCDPVRQRDELEKSHKALLEHTGRADLFAYPNGSAEDFTHSTKRLLKEVGYRCGLTTIRGLNSRGSDPYELRRVGVGSETTLADYELILSGY